jgi:hypothetical protein
MPEQKDLSHLHALRVRLSNERIRLQNAKTAKERELRAVWVAGIEREIEGELKFLGLTEDPEPVEMTTDELLAELGL